MTPAQIDRIAAAYMRTGLRKTIPEAARITATAQALKLPVEDVIKGLRLAKEVL